MIATPEFLDVAEGQAESVVQPDAAAERPSSTLLRRSGGSDQLGFYEANMICPALIPLEQNLRVPDLHRQEVGEERTVNRSNEMCRVDLRCVLLLCLLVTGAASVGEH